MCGSLNGFWNKGEALMPFSSELVRIKLVSNCSKLNFNLDYEAARLQDFEMYRILAISLSIILFN